MKTQAAVLNQVNKPLSIEELQIPELKAGQVLVKVSFSGVCHSQINEIRGLKGQDKYLPHTLGHEGSGVVQAIGPGVTKVKPQDQVVLTWIKGTGADVTSASYKRSDGTLVNSGAISTFLTEAVVSENRLVKIPEQMPLREATLLGCAIPTGGGIILNMAKVSSNTKIAIFGMGGIGFSALLMAKLNGAQRIIAVDIFDHKLKRALGLGATDIINARKEDVLTQIMEITQKQGVDYAIESAGEQQAMETAFQCVRNNGGLCIIAGNLPQGVKISLDPFNLISGKRIIGTWGGQTQPDRDVLVYVDLFLTGKLKLNGLITHTLKLEDINQALELLNSPEVGRVIIEMG